MIQYKKRVIANGLTILAHKDNSTPLAALNIIYKVGAKDEDYNKTGFAHLFEHLMFGGTTNVPSFDIPIQMASGENNAFTNNDYTNYYIVLPKNNLETALFMEADRMVNLDINQKSLSVQQKVVEEEYNERYKNKPYGDLWQILRPLVYKKHPYMWSTIGRDIDHVRKASLSDVTAFYEKFYTPQNAIVAVAADIDEDECLDMVEKMFCDIKKGTVVEKEKIIEPEQTSMRRQTVVRDVPSSTIFIVFHMAERLSRQFAICDIMSDLLSGGSSSRMYQSLIKEQRLFSSVNAYITGDVDNGMFIVSANLLPKTDLTTAEKALFAELEEMKHGEISDYELEKVKNKFEVNTIFGEINVMNKAMNLCFYDMLGDTELINRENAVFRSITKDEIHSTAKQLFTPQNSTVLNYLKQK